MAGFPTRTASLPTRRAAKRWAAKIEGEMVEGRHFKDAAGRRRTVAEAIDRYVEEEVPNKRGGGEMHAICLRWWKKQLGGLRLSEVTSDILATQRRKLGTEKYTRATPGSAHSAMRPGETPREYTRSPSTVNRYLECLSHVFTMARREWKWNVSGNPVSDVSKLREAKGRTRHLTDDERARLLAETAKDPQLHVLVSIALATAARAGELVGLKWSDVELRKTEGRLTFSKTKNDEVRSVLVYGEALRLLHAHHARRDRDVAAVFPGRAGEGGTARRYHYVKPFNAAVEAAGIEAFRFHDLRHSAATYLARLGATEQQLKAIGGWKSGVASRYVHLAAEDVRDTMQALANKLDGKRGKGQRT
jgi:integrase